MKLTIDTKWLDAISDLDDALRLTLLDAIFAYLEGREPLLGKEASVIFCTLKPFIDEELNKRIRIAERSRENGKKGGRKASSKPKEAPKKRKTFEDWLQEPEYQGRDERLLKLDAWKKKNTPYIYANYRPLTNREFACLLSKGYDARRICDTLLQIENRNDLRKRYTHPYRTLLNWLKNDYGNT